MISHDPYETFKATWRPKTVAQIERELASWRRRVAKHSAAYAWHGRGITPPHALADGDKITALRELLTERTADQEGLN